MEHRAATEKQSARREGHLNARLKERTVDQTRRKAGLRRPEGTAETVDDHRTNDASNGNQSIGRGTIRHITQRTKFLENAHYEI